MSGPRSRWVGRSGGAFACGDVVLNRVLDDDRVDLVEVESFAIDFLLTHLLAGGQRSRAAKPSQRDVRTRGAARRSEDRYALEG